ncbi:MAG TPA: sulfatase-like hydrolase/transferase [Terriglobales bacterium]|nr:sulfatase-like hydrolase/transferase [Terriglobales bacterium]
MFARTLYLRWFAPALLLLSPVLSRAAAKPNIVLITLDSVRADRMGFLGSSARLSPNLDRLAGQSIVFEQAFAQAPLTVASHATILSGTYPQTNRAGELGTRLASSLPFVPDLLRAGGDRTAAFVGSIALDPKNGFAPGFDRGFAVYDAGFHQPEKAQSGSVGRTAAQVVARASAWLARNPKGPFFLWVHLNDPAAASASSYNAAVSAADSAVGKLVAALRGSKLYDDALIVVASDHGQGLGAHGEDTHGVFLYDETLHVPLLLKLPQGQSAGKRVRVHARLVDIAPTILEIAGVTIPSQMQGQSLLRMAKANSSADQPVYSMTDFPQRAFGWSPLESWRTGKFLYIRAPRPELYDLSSDPRATRNLAEGSRATLETIASQLDAFDRRFSDPGNSAGGPELTSSEMQKLASLGYVGLQKPAGGTRAAVSGVDPKDGIAIANRVLTASALLDQGKPDKAMATLQPALAVASKMYLAQYVLGVALARQGQYPQSIERLRAAIELQPDSAWAHYEMGSSLLKTGDFGTAAIHLEIAASRLPDNPEVRARLAEAHERSDRAK